MDLWSTWNIAGIVTEARELKSEKNKSWRGYVAKVATLGAMFELQLTQQQYSQITEGSAMAFAGRFEEQGGRQRFVVEQMCDSSEAKRPEASAS